MENYKDSASFVLRLFLGLGFLVAGLDKITHLGMAKEMMFVPMFGGAGVAVLWLAIVLEIGGGLALLVGYQTRWAATVLTLLILVATFKTFNVSGGMDFVSTLREIFVMNTGGGNTPVNLMYLAGLLALAMGGSEKLAMKPE